MKLKLERQFLKTGYIGTNSSLGNKLDFDEWARKNGEHYKKKRQDLQSRKNRKNLIKYK